MMVNSAQPGVGGAHTPPFTLSTITSIYIVVYAPAERAETLLSSVATTTRLAGREMKKELVYKGPLLLLLLNVVA
jgi:hypothetical protein